MNKKIQYFPITSFAIILGLGALTVILDKWHYLQWLPEWPYTIMLYLVTGLFFLILSLYGMKAIYYPGEVAKDFNHNIRINFFSAIPISAILLSIIYMGRLPIASLSFWLIGTIGETILLFIIMSHWISRDVDILHYNPVWFIPIIGIILIPITGVTYFSNVLMLMFYAPAFFMWFSLFTIVLYRVIFHRPLPGKIVPTFFMIVAPPAVAFIAYVRIFRQIDPFSLSLLMIATFFLILLLFMRKHFIDNDFYLSWWSYTFPMGAITVAWTVAFLVTKRPVFAVPAIILGILTFVLDATVFAHTVKNIVIGNICIEED